MLHSLKRNQLPGFDGQSAFDGALRFLDGRDSAWFQGWRSAYLDRLPALRFFAADAFGTLFGLDDTGRVSSFRADSGEVEPLGITEEFFYGLIVEEPDAMLHLSLYCDAVIEIGRPAPDQDFALKVEAVQGGKRERGNLYICPMDTHLLALGRIARHIHSMNKKKPAPT